MPGDGGGGGTAFPGCIPNMQYGSLKPVSNANSQPTSLTNTKEIINSQSENIDK